MMTSLALKGKLIQFLPDESEETDDVTIFIDVMRGRINLSVLSRERWLIVRFDGCKNKMFGAVVWHSW